MKHWIKQILVHPLFSGSALMIIGTNATNVLNYVYHLIMGRLLGPIHYSELAVLLSLIGLIGILPAAFGPVIVKFISSSDTSKEVGSLITWFNKKLFFLGILLTTITIGFSFFIADFLKIPTPLLVIISSFIFLFMFPSVLNRGVLQGLLRFKETVISIVMENGSKLGLGVLFVYLGFSVSGAMFALVIASFLGWFLSRYFIKDCLHKANSSLPDVPAIVRFSVPVFVQTIAVTSLYSSDLILVKHFFPAHQAGLYAAISTLGKIIFFGAGPITAVMFPLVSKRQAVGQNYKKIFIISLILTTFLSLFILLVYRFFPDITINILYGPSYLEASDLLVLFGIFITLFTLSHLLINFLLSLGDTKVVILPFLASILQIVGIVIYHNSLMSVIYVSIVITTLLFFSLLIYLSYASSVHFHHRSSV